MLHFPVVRLIDSPRAPKLGRCPTNPLLALCASLRRRHCATAGRAAEEPPSNFRRRCAVSSAARQRKIPPRAVIRHARFTQSNPIQRVPRARAGRSRRHVWATISDGILGETAVRGPKTRGIRCDPRCRASWAATGSRRPRAGFAVLGTRTTTGPPRHPRTPRYLPTAPPPAPPRLIPMGGGSRALPLSSLCATTKPLLPFLAPAHRILPLRLAAAMSSSSSSTTPAAPAASGDAAAPAPSASNAINFLTLCYRLKTTKRAGWVRRGVQAPESVADHMYRMGVMALVAADLPGVDRDRCVKMAIVHDIAEAIVGDITPSDGVPKEEKSRREKEALDRMCELLGGGSRAQEIRELWMEYEENASLEAKLVKDFDKVEMILQALEYEKVKIRFEYQVWSIFCIILCRYIV
ncbi:uncharacterized protein LOC133918485 isoform X2 [Phragmites australis]|uniref:uncharacterized protein LOC133918485 isoform X2 n=1 Tax=Phragmites australis TaxID=29695 RepID=UPI002D796112|nr:uncharacterized protein LOC133918485 isoform X2 [Phragmites australis]